MSPKMYTIVLNIFVLFRIAEGNRVSDERKTGTQFSLNYKIAEL